MHQRWSYRAIDNGRRYLAEKKVEIVGELKAVKRHVEAIIRRDGKDVPVHIHRDGEITEIDSSARKICAWTLRPVAVLTPRQGAEIAPRRPAGKSRRILNDRRVQ